MLQISDALSGRAQTELAPVGESGEPVADAEGATFELHPAEAAPGEGLPLSGENVPEALRAGLAGTREAADPGAESMRETARTPPVILFDAEEMPLDDDGTPVAFAGDPGARADYSGVLPVRILTGPRATASAETTGRSSRAVERSGVGGQQVAGLSLTPGEGTARATAEASTALASGPTLLAGPSGTSDEIARAATEAVALSPELAAFLADDDRRPATAALTAGSASEAVSGAAPGVDAGANNVSSVKSPTPVNLIVGPATTSAEWGETVSNRVALMVSQSMQMARIHLNPPELGPLEVRVQVSDSGETQVQFVSQSSAVRDLLEQTLPRLREMLGAMGLELGDADIGGGDEPARDEAAPGVDEEAAEEETPVAQPAGLVDFYA